MVDFEVKRVPWLDDENMYGILWKGSVVGTYNTDRNEAHIDRGVGDNVLRPAIAEAVGRRFSLAPHTIDVYFDD